MLTNITSRTWGLLLLLCLSGCEALGTGGNVGLSIGGIVLGVILLGWLAVKFLVGALKIGFWGIVFFVLLVIGLIAFVVVDTMGI